LRFAALACVAVVMNRRIVALLTICVPLLGAVAQTATNYWDVNGVGAGLGGSGTWDTNTANWNDVSGTGTPYTWTNGAFEAVFGGTAGTVTMRTSIRANRFSFLSSGYYLVPTNNLFLTLVGVAPQIYVAPGVTATSVVSLAGADGFRRTGSGTLTLQSTNSASGTYRLTGGVILEEGLTILEGVQVNRMFRQNAVTISPGATLTVTNVAGNQARLGGLAGNGTAAFTSANSITFNLSGSQVFSGAITANGLTFNGVGSQIFTAASNWAGNLTINGNRLGATNASATLELSGTAAHTSSSGVSIRGALVLNNAVVAGTNRIANGSDIIFRGGLLRLIGNSTTGIVETVGTITLNSGANRIIVDQLGALDGTELRFTDSGSLRDQTSMTVDFSGTGGSLGSAGANPRITFSGTGLFVNTANGMLANSSANDARTIGWAVVDGTNWAGVGANGIVALADTARNSDTLSSAGNWELIGFTPSSDTTTLSANLGSSASLGPGVLKINPTASGQTLAVGTYSIFASALMLTGTNDFSITGTTGGLQVSSTTRYLWVTEEGTALNYGASFPSTGPLSKSGAGILNLNGSSSQLPAANFNLLQGVLRGTTTTLGGAAASGGANTTINLYGGVLEISGGGTLVRAATFGSAGGGGIRWRANGSGAQAGSGGFSAINGDASILLVDGPGSSVATNLIWDTSPNFVATGSSLIFGSVKADSRITFLNNIGLDDGVGAYDMREIRVVDNPDSTSDVARLAGTISGSTTVDLLKTGSGVLEFSGTNTYQGATLIREGMIRAVAHTNFSRTSKHIVMGGTLNLNGFTQQVGEVVLESGSIIGGGALTGSVFHVQSGVIASSLSGLGDLYKTQPGIVSLNTNSTFTGRAQVFQGVLKANAEFALGEVTQLVVAGGTLLLGGTGNRINDLAGVILSGGTLATDGLDEDLGALTLAANSVIDFGAGSDSVLTFASASGTWTGTLDILNWSGTAYTGGGAEQLRFTSDPTAYLSQITFAGIAGAVAIDNGTYFEVVPVPEPATVAGALGLLGVAGWWERRRWASLGRQLVRRAQRVPAYVIRNAVLAFFGFLIFGTIFFFA
jgi:fibronectin-binding autotransporter adhesin